MVKSISSFISAFNFGILNAKRRTTVPNTFSNRTILVLLYERGYVLSYSVTNNVSIEIYQNFTIFPFKLKAFRRATTRFISNHELKALANSGRIFVLSTGSGYIFSDLALINGVGGTVVFEVKFIY